MLNYFVIIFAVFIILSYIFAFSNKQIITKQTINYNKQLLQSLNSYLDLKYRQLKDYNALFYNDKASPNQNEFLFDYLNRDLDENSEEYTQTIKAIDTFFKKNIFGLNGDIKNLILFRTSDWRYHGFTAGNSIQGYQDLVSAEIIKAWKEGTIYDRFFYTPALVIGESNPTYYVYIFDAIRPSEDFTKPIGLIALGIRPDSFKNAYNYFKDNIKGETIIFDKKAESCLIQANNIMAVHTSIIKSF
jgi:hypothetical protein